MLSPPSSSFSEYLHEKADESRHNETIGYLVVIIGAVFFVGGLVVTVLTVEIPGWYLTVPLQLLISLSLASVGVALLGLGIVLGIHYAKERSWYMKELHRAYAVEEQKLRIQKQNETKESNQKRAPGRR